PGASRPALPSSPVPKLRTSSTSAPTSGNHSCIPFAARLSAPAATSPHHNHAASAHGSKSTGKPRWDRPSTSAASSSPKATPPAANPDGSPSTRPTNPGNALVEPRNQRLSEP